MVVVYTMVIIEDNAVKLIISENRMNTGSKL